MEQLQIAVCTEKKMTEKISEGIGALKQSSGVRIKTDWFYRREDLLYGMRRSKYAIVLIALTGALGMEAAIGAREENAAVPLIWISDEEAFALQSYRLQTKMFLVWPVSTQQICDAFLRCMENLPNILPGTERKEL
ncbi:MAG: hypothetical protein VB082_03055 [Christensenella sp.]|nr:hypothetical protein [Christensenella sp.]